MGLRKMKPRTPTPPPREEPRGRKPQPWTQPKKMPKKPPTPPPPEEPEEEEEPETIAPRRKRQGGERGGKDRALAKARQEEPRHIHTGPLPWRDTAAGSAKKPFLGYYVLQAHEVDPRR